MSSLVMVGTCPACHKGVYRGVKHPCLDAIKLLNADRVARALPVTSSGR